MEITYIGHSGFLMEWETCYWLFDYYRGEIPVMNPEKKIIVFSSHKHEDHFNPKIFELQEQYPDILYVMSSDINLSSHKLNKLGIPESTAGRILSVKPSDTYDLKDKNGSIISLETLKSTDCGVAFLLRYQDRTVYHAGDLNLWLWEGETKQSNNNMKALFVKEMRKLKDLTIDIAFVPLDPRQEKYYSAGLEQLINTATIKHVFPMHFGVDYAVIQRYKKEIPAADTEIKDITVDGQSWELTL